MAIQSAMAILAMLGHGQDARGTSFAPRRRNNAEAQTWKE
jgi:hypothetical protein